MHIELELFEIQKVRVAILFASIARYVSVYRSKSHFRSLIGANDWLCAVDSVDLQAATPPDPPGNLEFFLLVNTIMPPFEKQWNCIYF